MERREIGGIGDRGEGKDYRGQVGERDVNSDRRGDVLDEEKEIGNVAEGMGN